MTATPETAAATPGAAPKSVPSRPPRVARARAWTVWGALAGILGFAGTVLFDHRPASEGEAADAGIPYVLGPEHMEELSRMPNYLGFLVGFAAVAAMFVFAAVWKRWVEVRFPESIAARVVSGGLIASAAGLTFAYGWKGALANYGFDGPESGLYEHEGLFVYYMLTDFGAYIPWFGVLVAAAAFAWLAWRERLVSRVLGTISGVYFLLIVVAYVLMGVPGLAGPLSGIWLFIASIWLLVGRSKVTQKVIA